MTENVSKKFIAKVVGLYQNKCTVAKSPSRQVAKS